MSIWVDRQWADQIKTHLQKFHWKRDNVAEFRCPVCGDSDKNERKTRGYLYPDKENDILRIHCHNCGYARKFSVFLKDYFPFEYQEYRLDVFKQNTMGGNIPGSAGRPSTRVDQHGMIPDKPLPMSHYRALKTGERLKRNSSTETESAELDKDDSTSSVNPPAIPDVSLKRLVCLDHLGAEHMGVQYVRGREIPSVVDSLMHFTGDFEAMIHSNWPEAGSEFKFLPQDDRLVFLMRESEPPHHVFALQGRALGNSGMRYITMKTNPDADCKIFGLERLDRRRRHLVFEGPIDSLFFQNSVALCGGDIGTSLKYVDKENAIYVFDNEPRSKDTIKRMKTAIDKGAKVAFFDYRKYRGLKDVNKMIENGFDSEEILADIVSNSYTGPRAMLELSQWKRR